MKSLIPSLMLVSYLVCLPPGTIAQSKDANPSAQGSISGQVRIEGKPAQGVIVALMPKNSSLQAQPLAKVQADAQGRFRLLNVATGTYVVRALAPGFISSEIQNFEQGKSVTVDEGETIDGVDFLLRRGAVITGRIVDANRQPLIETRVELRQVDEQNRSVPFYLMNPFANRTDDRGVYRIFGLPAGRYKVSVGRAPGDGSLSIGQGGGYYLKTYHPNVTDESRAEIIEVKEGREAANIDITVAAALKTFSATGRIIDAATGQPLANINYGYGTLASDGKALGSRGFAGNRSNARGEFSIDELVPGRYAAILWTDGTMEGFAEPAPFEIKDSNITGLEIRVQRGGSISGVAVLEGTNDPEIVALLQQQVLTAQETSMILGSGSLRPPRIAPDGSFRINGLPAGKIQIRAFTPSNERKLTLSRIEHNGTPQKEIELKAGEEVTDVRLIFVYGTGVIRGQVNFENGASPEGARFMVFVVPANKEGQQIMPITVDARGKFIIEGLTAGEYELRLQNILPAPGLSQQPVRKTVMVTSGAETQVTFVLDANGKDKEERDKDNR
jgi:hypothetical protein